MVLTRVGIGDGVSVVVREVINVTTGGVSGSTSVGITTRGVLVEGTFGDRRGSRCLL